MDIRNYFSGKQKTTGSCKIEDKSVQKLTQGNDTVNLKVKTGSSLLRKRKKPIVLSDSDDEDPIPTKMKQVQRTVKPSAEIKDNSTRKSRRISPIKLKSSPIKPKTLSKDLKKPTPMLPTVSVNDYFGRSPVIQKKKSVLVASEKKKEASMSEDDFEIHDDDDFMETLKELDKKQNKEKCASLENTSSQETKKDQKSTRTQDTDKINQQSSCTKSQVEKDSPAAEGKKKNVENYRNYLARAAPQALGSKLIPEGAEACFQGLTFVITGVLESMEREDAVDLVKKYNGRVTQSVSKNTSYIVTGRDAGPSKLEKAEKIGVEIINEDQFLQLIVTKSENNSVHKSPQRQCKTARKVHSPRISKTLTTLNPQLEPTTTIKELPQLKKLSSQRTSLLQSGRSAAVMQKPAKNAVPPTKVVSSKEMRSIVADKVSVSELLWVDKHKPTNCKQIIGQQGDRSNMRKLTHWLLNWSKNNAGGKRKKAPFGKWAANDDGSSFKAALLSGPPGIGKTTTASLVCKELDFTFVELNASDTRSKRNLQEVVQELLTNSTISSFTVDSISGNKHCLLMDEVDGMSGNEDRGGVQELIQLIKLSKIPIICMCNDRNHPKIRSLSNHCFDLRFQRPRVDQLKGAMLSLCCKENINISSQALEEVIIGANQDVRQIIHHLSLWAVNDKTISKATAHDEARKAKKDEKLNPFETVKKVFSAEDHKKMSIHDKTELFFYDYSLSPLFVQENYIHMNPIKAIGNKKKQLQFISKCADSISDGDLVDRSIRSGGNWNLLPLQALYASIIPGEIMAANVSHQVMFPSWLGKYSRRNKLLRLLQELAIHMHLRTNSNKTNLNLDYIYMLRDKLTQPLLQKEMNGVHESISVLHDYDLLRDDLDNIIELSLWPGKQDPFSGVNSKVKAAFTRTYNTSGHLNPYTVSAIPLKKKGNVSLASDLPHGDEEVNNDSDSTEDESITNDGMIKQLDSKKRKQSKESGTFVKGKGRGKRTKL